jgi:hypothetical protein
MPVRVVPRSLTEAYKKREGDFAPNLVGFQATSAPLFTLGNFAITTNLEGKFDKSFDLGGEWSDYYSLDNLNLTEEESKLMESNHFFIDLNFDISKIDRYAHFGSLTEFVRVNIEQIILGWKGSLYVNKDLDEPALNTVLTYSYDSATDTSTFKIPTSATVNNFNLIYEDNETFSTEVGDISNLKNSFDKYFLWNEFGSFIINNYNGSTEASPYIDLEVLGEAWPELTGSTIGSYNYHLRPLPDETEKFFLGLTDFQKVMLNTLIIPKYTLELEIPFETDDGNVVNEKRKFSWPTTDGYNLDINGYKYSSYIDSLFEATQQYDRLNSDLVSRKYVSASIHEFDTPGDGTQDTGQKVQKLLRIYGREFDDIKKYVDGISFANVVTYNKRDNTSDELIKMMAKTLGLDVLETIFGDDFNLIDYNSAGENPQFAGFSREYSPKEIEIEFWRRLVINAWWLWKSKGTRKVLEFFLKLFGISDCLVDLNEHVYIAGNRLETSEVLQQIEDYFELIGDPREVILDDYPMDVYGYPRTLPNSEDYWFQMEGGWYNGGTENTIGNNPHFGPYDYGSKYINKFSNFIDDQITSVTGDTTTTIENLFTNYGSSVNGTNVDTFTATDGDTQVNDAQDARKYTIITDSCDVCQGVTVGDIVVTTPSTPFSDPVTITATINAPNGSTYLWDTDNGGGGTGPPITNGQSSNTVEIEVDSTWSAFEVYVQVDTNGCITNKNIIVDYSGNFVSPFSCTVTPSVGNIVVDFNGGTTPYQIILTESGFASNTYTTSNNTYTIPNLSGNDYDIIVTDGSGAICQNGIVTVPNATDPTLEDIRFQYVTKAVKPGQASSNLLAFIPYYLVGGNPVAINIQQMSQLNNEIYNNNTEPSWFNQGIDNDNEIQASKDTLDTTYNIFKPFSIGVRSIDVVGIPQPTDKVYYNLPCIDKPYLQSTPLGSQQALNNDYAVLMYSDTGVALSENTIHLNQSEIYFNPRNVGSSQCCVREFAVFDVSGDNVIYFDDGFHTSSGQGFGGGFGCDVFNYTVSPKVFLDHVGPTAPSIFNGIGTSTTTITDGLTGVHIGTLPNNGVIGKSLVGNGVICVFDDNGYFLEDIKEEVFDVLTTVDNTTSSIFDSSVDYFGGGDFLVDGGNLNIYFDPFTQNNPYTTPQGVQVNGKQYIQITGLDSSQLFSVLPELGVGFPFGGPYPTITISLSGGQDMTFTVIWIQTGQIFGNEFDTSPADSVVIFTDETFSVGISQWDTFTITSTSIPNSTTTTIPITYSVPRNLTLL